MELPLPWEENELTKIIRSFLEKPKLKQGAETALRDKKEASANLFSGGEKAQQEK